LSPDPHDKKVIPIHASDESDSSAFLYAATPKIYPRTVQGIFAHWRWVGVFITQLVFYGLPWLEWGQRQAVLFDLGARRFYVFGLVLYPQDFIYLTGLLVVSALSLFLFTAVAGRLWCGYACPQTVYSEIFMYIERKVEGDRTARMRLDAGNFTMEKLVKKTYKHIVWLGFSIWTGFTFVGYFTPIHELGMEFFQSRMGSWEVFWVFFYGLATYGNAGFMREQVCKYMCPYARFQSAMFDHDTLIVTYDDRRGEPRGHRPHSVALADSSMGACIDCNLCVQVCPTGIDIRNGLQYECIGCGACADVCDGVMDKMGYERGLVRYSTQNAMNNGWSTMTMLKSVFRPRVLIYTAILWTLIFALGISLYLRTPLKVDVVKDRGMPRYSQIGEIENVYRLQLMNATESRLHLKIEVRGVPEIEIESEDDIVVEAAQSRWVPVRVELPHDALKPGSHKIWFDITNEDGSMHVTEASVFVVPR
jgi:cytochrome c oxidase accessory protein FixG